MTQNPSPEPDPQPHPAPLDVWALARRDYLAGDTAPIVAERYGLSERTLQRRAAGEKWRRSDVKAPPFACQSASLNRMVRHFKELVDSPHMQPVHTARQTAKIELLMAPDSIALRLFAFRQAAECAAMDLPGQAIQWMRLVQQLDRSGDRVDREDATFPEADHLRATYKELERITRKKSKAAA